MPRRGRRDDLLDAAERVLSRGGSGALTLDAVAAEANASKGGLLYHFATKQALIEALIARLISGTDVDYDSWDDGTPGGFTRAYISSTAAALKSKENQAGLRRWAVILAAGTEPGLQTPIGEAFARWTRQDQNDRAPINAQIARLAIDGLWMNAQFAEELRDPALVAQIEEGLLKLADEVAPLLEE